MTVSTTANRLAYQGNGATLEFSFPYKFFANSDLVVYDVTIATGAATLLELGVDYTVSGAGESAGGTVTLIGDYVVDPPASTHSILIIRTPPLSQALSLSGNEFPPDSVEAQLDKLVLQVQRMQDQVDRSARLNDALLNAGVSLLLGKPEAGKYFRWNSLGTGIEYAGAGDGGGGGSVDWDDLINKPTTLAGIGITDAQPLDSDLTTLAAAITAAGHAIVAAASAAAQTALLTAFTGDSGLGGVKGLVPAPAGGDAAGGKFLAADGTWKAGSGLGDMLAAQNLNDLANKSTARTNLGVAIGTNVQAYSAVLAALAALTPTTYGKALLELADTAALMALLSAASLTVAGKVELATAAELRVGTDTERVPAVDQIWAAAAIVGLTDGASIAVDMSLGLNFSVTLGGNRTLANPTNTKVGQSGAIVVTQDGTGTRTLAYGSNWEAAGGSFPVLSTAAGAKDVIFYWVQSSGSIIITGILKALA